MADLLSKFAETVAAHPDRAAIVNPDGECVSFIQLQSRANGLAAHWASEGIQRGDRVLLAMGISSDLYASLSALWSLGATVVLPEPAMGLGGLKHAIKTSNVKAFCAAGAYRGLKLIVPQLWSVKRLSMVASPGQSETRTPESHDIALISFTSGTTGAPKAIPRSHGFLMAQHDAVAPLLSSLTAERDLVAFPVFALINLAGGRTSVLPNWKMGRLADVSPDHLRRWISNQNVTRALLPPSLCETLAQAGPVENLRHIFTGGGPIFPDTLGALAKAHPKVDVTCVYGSTEAEPIAHLRHTEISDQDLADMQDGQGLLVGQATNGTQVRIVGDEIQVAGDHVNRGYLDPAHDAENKIVDGDTIWHRTGDAGRFDATGRLWLLGRIGTDAKIAEAKTYPFAIEVAVRQWAGVNSCALIAANGTPILIVTGNKSHLSDWQTQAAILGITDVRHLAFIPMDKRHGSKVDRRALLSQLGS